MHESCFPAQEAKNFTEGTIQGPHFHHIQQLNWQPRAPAALCFSLSGALTGLRRCPSPWRGTIRVQAWCSPKRGTLSFGVGTLAVLSHAGGNRGRAQGRDLTGRALSCGPWREPFCVGWPWSLGWLPHRASCLSSIPGQEGACYKMRQPLAGNVDLPPNPA